MVIKCRETKEEFADINFKVKMREEREEERGGVEEKVEEIKKKEKIYI